MTRHADTRVVLIALLALVAIILTVLRERPRPGPPSGVSAGGAGVRDRSYAMVDTLLRREGALSVRRLRPGGAADSLGRRELRVGVTASFETLRLMKALQDSLAGFGVRIVATENLREKTSTLHLVAGSGVIESVVISRETPRKGAASSQSRVPQGRVPGRRARR